MSWRDRVPAVRGEESAGGAWITEQSILPSGGHRGRGPRDDVPPWLVRGEESVGGAWITEQSILPNGGHRGRCPSVAGPHPRRRIRGRRVDHRTEHSAKRRTSRTRSAGRCPSPRLASVPFRVTGLPLLPRPDTSRRSRVPARRGSPDRQKSARCNRATGNCHSGALRLRNSDRSRSLCAFPCD